jgi:peptidoglycan/xylan/chitin deacetylase (PgdA/CDA1 family)
MSWLLAAAALALAGFSLQYAWWRPAVDYRAPRLLMYHMISAPRTGSRYNGLRVAPAMFERQLRWLQADGWRSMTVSELIEAGERLPPKSYAITFDDGYADNFLQALPLLQKYGCRATLYLVVEREGRDWSRQRKAHHADGELMREAKLSDAQVQAMLDSGCIELGSHSLTHANFKHLDNSDVVRELQQSRTLLEQRFGVDIKSFAYPFGLYRPDHPALVKQAGYRNAVTTLEGAGLPGAQDPYQLMRIKIGGRDGWFAFRLRLRSGRKGWR